MAKTVGQQTVLEVKEEEDCVPIIANLLDGQRILELGSGWGSLTLWMAANYRRSHITAVSNSASQRAWIEAQVLDRGLDNVTVILIAIDEQKVRVEKRTKKYEDTVVFDTSGGTIKVVPVKDAPPPTPAVTDKDADKDKEKPKEAAGDPTSEPKQS